MLTKKRNPAATATARARRGHRTQVLHLVVSYVRSGRWYSVSVLNGEGVHSQGRTLVEARRAIVDAALLMAESAPHQLGRGQRRRAPAGARVEDLYLALS